MWVKTTAAGASVLGNLSSNSGWAYFINGDQHHAFFGAYYPGDGFVPISNFTDVNDGAWHHLATSWDASTRTLRAFTDGVLGETKITSGPIVMGATPLTLGEVASAFGQATLDEVRISSTVRYTGNFTPQHS